MYGKYEDVFPDVSDLQTFGLTLKGLRLSKGLSQKFVGELVGRSSTWVRDLEHWKLGYRSYADGVIMYMCMLGFSLIDSMLLIQHFDLWPDTQYGMLHLVNTVCNLRNKGCDVVYNTYASK